MRGQLGDSWGTRAEDGRREDHRPWLPGSVWSQEENQVRLGTQETRHVSPAGTTRHRPSPGAEPAQSPRCWQGACTTGQVGSQFTCQGLRGPAGRAVLTAQGRPGPPRKQPGKDGAAGGGLGRQAPALGWGRARSLPAAAAATKRAVPPARVSQQGAPARTWVTRLPQPPLQERRGRPRGLGGQLPSPQSAHPKPLQATERGFTAGDTAESLELGWLMCLSPSRACAVAGALGWSRRRQVTLPPRPCGGVSPLAAPAPLNSEGPLVSSHQPHSTHSASAAPCCTHFPPASCPSCRDPPVPLPLAQASGIQPGSPSLGLGDSLRIACAPDPPDRPAAHLHLPLPTGPEPLQHRPFGETPGFHLP